MRKPASDSIQGKIDAAMAADVEYDVPEGLRRLTKREKTLWGHFTSAKTRWKLSELVMLHSLVSMYRELWRLERLKADTVEILQQHKAIQAQTRLLGLNCPASTASKSAGDGQSARGKRTPDAPAPRGNVSFLK